MNLFIAVVSWERKGIKTVAKKINFFQLILWQLFYGRFREETYKLLSKNATDFALYGLPTQIPLQRIQHSFPHTKITLLYKHRRDLQGKYAFLIGIKLETWWLSADNNGKLLVFRNAFLPIYTSVFVLLRFSIYI